MNTPLISIIIPTYNRAHLIGETLDSVLNQTYQNWECIIVDDGSTDNTYEIVNDYIKKDNRFHLYHRPKDRLKGANTCRNYGFELSKGEYINWFDDDDLMMPDFLELKVNAFSDNLFFVIGTGSYWNPNNQIRENIDVTIRTTLYQDYLMWRVHILTPSLLFKRNFLVNKDLFSINIKRGQETELFSRLFFQITDDKYKIVNVPLFLYRQHEGTKTEKNKIYNNKYKESQAFICVENLKKSLIIDNRELTNYYYKAIIDLFFRALENNHTENLKFIFSDFVSILMRMRKVTAYQFYILGNVFLLIKRGSYRVEKYFKSVQF